MEDDRIARLQTMLDERTMALMARESDLADRSEEMDAQKEELSAAIEELQGKNNTLTETLAQLKERNQELDQILYRCSHDLKAPISSIVGLLNILNYGPLSEDQKTCVDHIQVKTSQMDELLRSLSALAKTTADDVHFDSFNINSLVKNCMEDFSSNPQSHYINLHCQSVGKEDAHSDRLLLSIVIKNLLANSLIFRQPNVPGFIKIKTSVSDQFLEIEMEDDGEGIADSIKEHVFEMFYRGSERSNGSGLGLYIARKIVDQLAGTIDFISKAGSTTFKVKIPSKKKTP
jgi:signal transduction histidine kinase